MASNVETINTASDTWGHLISRVNQLIGIANSQTVTVAQTPEGDVVSGNGYVDGIMSIETVAVGTALRGGNLSTSDVLTIASDVLYDGVEISIDGVATINSSGYFIGSVTIEGSNVAVGNVFFDTGSMRIGSNAVVVNSTSVYVANNDLRRFDYASTKGAIVDGDFVIGADSAASNSAIRTSWTSVKAFLKTYFDGVYQAVGSYVTTDRSVLAGNGLSGGGNLASSRTISLATPSSITFSSTNHVNSTTHTHEITLTANDVANAVGYVPPPIQRLLTAGDGLTGGGDLTEDRTFAVDGSVVRTSRTVAAGNGLSGGGDLSSNRTITLGTPGAVNSTSTNSVNSTSHSHALVLVSADITGALGFTPPPNGRTLTAGDGLSGGGDLTANRTFAVDASVVRTSRQIIAGNGLTGGGNTAADRTIALGTPGTINSTSTNSVNTTSHSHALVLVSADVTGALGFTPPPDSRQIIAGNGLTGGGTLGANRTITLGTPETITFTTQNSVGATNHTHALSIDWASLSGEFGSPIMLVDEAATTTGHTNFRIGHYVLVTSNTALGRNQTASVYTSTSGVAAYTLGSGTTQLAGTWRSRGAIVVGSAIEGYMMQRIS